MDVCVADGLNAQMRSKHIAGVLAVADQLSVELGKIGDDLCFWDLSPHDVATQPTDASSPAWSIWRAWTILIGVDGIDVACTHKILHHKRPKVFPLVDNETVDQLTGSGSAWEAILHDLRAVPDAWSQLEDEVAARVPRPNLTPLTRLRLHDILLWTYATNRWQTALG
ncbi:MAG: DUF6308 family protein, partial [Acidimicrobiales bacterium]